MILFISAVQLELSKIFCEFDFNNISKRGLSSTSQPKMNTRWVRWHRRWTNQLKCALIIHYIHYLPEFRWIRTIRPLGLQFSVGSHKYSWQSTALAFCPARGLQLANWPIHAILCERNQRSATLTTTALHKNRGSNWLQLSVIPAHGVPSHACSGLKSHSHETVLPEPAVTTCKEGSNPQ